MAFSSAEQYKHKQKESSCLRNQCFLFHVLECARIKVKYSTTIVQMPNTVLQQTKNNNNNMNDKKQNDLNADAV